jgi:ferric-dicitrate binding protein FerR (iron transport regulator)
MLPNQFRELLDRFSRGLCTPEEEQFINEWYHNIGEKEAPLLPAEEKLQVEQNLWAAINPHPARGRKNSRILLRFAAVLIPLLIAAAVYVNRQELSLVTGVSSESLSANHDGRVFENTGDSPQMLKLSDGSVVVLQPSSRMTVDESFGTALREVHLTGEAFFDVKPDERKPFLVYTNEVVTRVLGTSFNIKAYNDDKEITVAVKSGRVSVYANNAKTSRQVRQSQEVILTPNQQMVYHRLSEVISRELVEKPEIVLPNSNLFRMQFDNAEVSQIFDVLQRNYGVEIRYDKNILSNCRLTTSMSDEGLYERVAVICKAIGASYWIDDAVITIKSNGC